ncbi:hypothetical protein MMC15_001560 [Xylographa vitiligo]|nr:hypothetical protein [Xylographa vitiligo]
MSAELQQHLETGEECQMQRAIEASLKTSTRSQLSQGNSSTRRKKWEALRSPYTHLDTEQEQSPHSYTGAEYSGHRENITAESDTDRSDEGTAHMSEFDGTKPPDYEKIFQAKLRAIAEGSSATDTIVNAEMIPTRLTIDDYIAEMQQMRAVDLTRLSMPDGDTLVFIDAPAQQPDQDDFTYKQIQARYANPFCMRSTTLKSLGSSFFDFLLNPTAQFRVLRRRKLVNNLPYGIKYVLDLSPPNEGDDAVRLTADLSCKIGVRQWGLSCDRWMISEGLVGGHDELSRMKVQSKQAKSPTKIQWVQGTGTVTETVVVNDTADLPGGAPKTPVQRSTAFDIASSPIKESAPGSLLQDQRIGNVRGDYAFQLPADYTPIRHRFAIERVLNGIEGRDPKIDSAVKLWTTFAVAKHFGIRDSLLTDYIVRWLRAPPNTYFMEVQPEVTLRIAEGLHCQAVGRDAFAILVGEAALAVVCEGRDTDLHYSVHGRRKESVNDTHFEQWLTRIQYARDVLVERVKAQFEDLTSMKSTWVEELPECQKLLALTHSSPRHRSLYAELMKALKMYVRGAIYYLLCSTYTSMPGPVEDTGKGAELFPQTQFCSTWNLLTYHERVFTRSFWENLRGSEIVMSNANYGVRAGFKYDLSIRTPAVLRDLVKAGVFKNIYPGELREMVGVYCSLNDSGMKDTTTAATHSLHHNDTHFGPGSAWVTESSSVEKRARKLPAPPALNIPYRPRTDKTSSSSDFSAIDDDWRNDWRNDYVPVPEDYSHGNLLDTIPLNGESSRARGAYWSQVFPLLSHHGDPYGVPTHGKVFYDNNDEGPSKRRCSEVSEESLSRLQAQHVRRAEENKRELEELHEHNRSSFGERRQHGETICTGSPSSSPCHNFDPSDPSDPFAGDSFPATRGSPDKNLLSVKPTLRQLFSTKPPSISKSTAPKISGRLRVFDGEPLAFPNNFVSTPSQTQKTPKSPPPAYDSHSFDHESDTLDSATFAPHEDYFDIGQFFREAEKHIHMVAGEMLAAPDAGQRDPLELALTNTLVCLKESEMMFLPLWAGGNDDGSSGVFDGNIPLAESGFSTAGPKVHTGTASSAGSSEFDMLRDDSTVHTSTVVHDGHSDAVARGHVYDEDSEWGAVMANKNYHSSAQTLDGSESTWDNITTPAGTDDMSVVDAGDATASKLDKRKGKMVDLTTLVSPNRASTAATTGTKGEEEEEEAEDYSEIFMHDDDDSSSSSSSSDAAASDLDDISTELEFWNDEDFNDELSDEDLAANEAALAAAAAEMAAE